MKYRQLKDENDRLRDDIDELKHRLTLAWQKNKDDYSQLRSQIEHLVRYRLKEAELAIPTYLVINPPQSVIDAAMPK
jgi:hypothetical protein